jgi:hypothetical protein
MTIKTGQPLVSLGPEVSSAVMSHPAQRASFGRIAGLIADLRACERPGDFYEFQRRLFSYLYQVEERRGQCSRMIKRLRRGRRAPQDAPPLPIGGDPGRAESWELEAYVYERVARQLRMVGDGLAWRCFGYDRRVILTLCRNASPGPMYGKEGLPHELERLRELWENDGHFALHHDLTNCLRIADLTEFTDDGMWLREIKRTPHTERAQVDRAQVAIAALMHDGELPGPRRDARLVALAEPYATNLAQLGELIQMAKDRGCAGTALSQGRALVATSLPACLRRWGADHAEQGRVLAATRQQAIEQAGIAMAMHHIRGVSGDTASRSPIMAPWSIYPFTPEECAALICDLLVFETIVADESLVAGCEQAGLRAELLLQPMDIQVSGAMGVLRAHWRERALTWHAHSLGLVLYELVEPNALARGTKETLQLASPPTEPVMVYAGEARTWLPTLTNGSG